MWWTARATLPDRPGSLACLAQECGKAGVNIVGLQVFPVDDRVVDELVLSTPADWSFDDVRELLERSGGLDVVGNRCGEEVLVDQPTRYVDAARRVLADPSSFPDVVAHLFDADVLARGSAQDVMELTVGEVAVQIRRRTPFTAVEHARGASMADLVSDVLGRDRPAFAPSGGRRMGDGARPEYLASDDGITVVADGVPIARAAVAPTRSPEPDGPVVHEVTITVDAAWRRRGVGTRLLGDAARLARGLGADEIVLTTASDNRAVLPMVLAAGMRGRIRMAGDVLTVRIAVHELRPLDSAGPPM